MPRESMAVVRRPKISDKQMHRPIVGGQASSFDNMQEGVHNFNSNAAFVKQ